LRFFYPLVRGEIWPVLRNNDTILHPFTLTEV
jgi:hypothetical protein